MSDIAILFGGESREQLVSVASAQNIATALPEAHLWHWRPSGEIIQVDRAQLAAHTRPFELPFLSDGPLVAESVPKMLEHAAATHTTLVLGLHGGAAEDGELAALCEAANVAFTGTGSVGSRIAFDKVSAKECVSKHGCTTAPSLYTTAQTQAEALHTWLAQYGRLIAKPVADGSSFGLCVIDGPADIDTVLEHAVTEAYLVEPFLAGREATVAVVDTEDGLIALPAVEIIASANRLFDYSGKYLGQGVREVCPADFEPDIEATLRSEALKAHHAIGAFGYSRSDFIVTDQGPVFLETNTLPGLSRSSLVPMALRAANLDLPGFLRRQIRLADTRRAQGGG